MKIVRGATPIVILLCLAIREFFLFSSSVSQHDQHQTSFVSQIFVSAKPSYLVVFFTFNIIVVALLLGISTQHSSFSSSSLSELPLLSFIDSFEGLKREKDEDYDDYGGHFIHPIIYVEYKEEKAQVESYDDFSYYKKDIENTDDRGYVYGYDDEVLSYENFCCDEEIMCEEEIYSELDDEDFNKRIEEFIDEKNKKWREELQNERLLDLDI